MRCAGAKYHPTVRGNGRDQVFFGAEDYARFLEQLDAALAEDQVILYAYVLMPNTIIWPEDRRPAVGEVEAAVLAEFGFKAEDLRFHGHRLGVLKAVALDLCCRHSGATQREVAQRFGYRHESAVGKARRVARAALGADGALARQADRVEKSLCNRTR
jgi:hypothetical protein